MRLILNSEKMQFQAASSFEARLDKDGVQRRDKSGGTNLPLWAVQLVAWFDAGAETILVTVAVSDPPKVSQGGYVSVERLQAMPWVQNGTNAVKVAYRADAVVPVTAGYHGQRLLEVGCGVGTDLARFARGGAVVSGIDLPADFIATINAEMRVGALEETITVTGETPIVPIIVGETALAIQMSDLLLDQGGFVTGFGYPVGPQGTARVRCLMAEIRAAQEELATAFQEAGRSF